MDPSIIIMIYFRTFSKKYTRTNFLTLSMHVDIIRFLLSISLVMAFQHKKSRWQKHFRVHIRNQKRVVKWVDFVFERQVDIQLIIYFLSFRSVLQTPLILIELYLLADYLIQSLNDPSHCSYNTKTMPSN